MPLKRCNKDRHKHIETWTINNISSQIAICKTSENTYLHHEFSSGFEGKDKWQLTLEIVHHPEIFVWIIGYFKAVNNVDIVHHAHVTVYILLEDKTYQSLGNKIIRADHKNGSNLHHYYILKKNCPDVPEFDDDIESKLPNDTLTLRIEVITYADDEPMFPPLVLKNPFPIKPREDITDQQRELYDNRNLTGDVIIQVDNNKFRVHRNILKQFCSVLDDLIGDRGAISLDSDVSAETFEMILEYIYLRDVKSLDDNAEQLLQAAHYFGLSKLKYLCEKSLAENYVGYDNLKEAYDLAERYDARILSKYAFLFAQEFYQRYPCPQRWPQNNPSTVEELKTKYGLPIFIFPSYTERLLQPKL